MNLSTYIKDKKIRIIVRANASKTQITGYDVNKEAVKLDVKAHPEKGKANAEIIKFLSKQLKKKARIISGHTSRKKIVQIE